MTISSWLYFFDEVPSHTRASVTAALEQANLTLHPFTSPPHGFGVVVFDRMDDANLRELRVMTRSATVLAISTSPSGLDSARMWEVLEAGAADLLLWSKLPAATDQVVSRLQRWNALQNLIESAPVKGTLIGKNPLWRNLVRSVVEVAAFTQASVLITGETGTGKELIAHLIHNLDSRTNKGDLIVVDCTTLSPELSGSELFGHERGAFTGAVTARDGAFSLADGGTLFLDEVGELSLPLQAQLLRAVQEHKYKRVGGNTWQHTEFRLICATNRDMEAEVTNGNFRADLYYRIAGCRCRTPSLRERRDDILLLVSHFLGQMDPKAATFDLDPAVREYLLTRDYPGNIRDLYQTVKRIWHRHTGPGPITIGDVPVEERQCGISCRPSWPDRGFEGAIRHAVDLGIGLKEISQNAADLAMQVALEQESDNLQRAAYRLGVTDRALQMRRANRRAPPH